MRLVFLTLILLAGCAQLSVSRVIDGDTFKLADGRTLRLAGVDCPEPARNRKYQAGGEMQCTLEVERGRVVISTVQALVSGATAEVWSKSDKYGRVLGYMRLVDGTDLGLYLIKSGQCADVSERYPHPRAKDWK